MVDNNHGIYKTSLQEKNMTPPPKAPLDKQGYCKVNTIPLIDEYAVEN